MVMLQELFIGNRELSHSYLNFISRNEMEQRLGL